MENLISLHYVLNSLVFSFIGIGILLLVFWLLEKLTPQNIMTEIFEKKNNAVAMVVAAFILAIGLIICSAIHG